jgi:hypothetical protein
MPTNFVYFATNMSEQHERLMMKRQQRGFRMQGGNNEQSGAASGALDRSWNCELSYKIQHVTRYARALWSVCPSHATPLHDRQESSSTIASSSFRRSSKPARSPFQKSQSIGFHPLRLTLRHSRIIRVKFSHTSDTRTPCVLLKSNIYLDRSRK